MPVCSAECGAMQASVPRALSAIIEALFVWSESWTNLTRLVSKKSQFSLTIGNHITSRRITSLAAARPFPWKWPDRSDVVVVVMTTQQQPDFTCCTTPLPPPRRPFFSFLSSASSSSSCPSLAPPVPPSTLPTPPLLSHVAQHSPL